MKERIGLCTTTIFFPRRIVSCTSLGGVRVCGERGGAFTYDFACCFLKSNPLSLAIWSAFCLIYVAVSQQQRPVDSSASISQKEGAIHSPTGKTYRMALSI